MEKKAEVVCLHSKEEVERFCRRNPALHVYSLGDLDDFFWPHTTWYAYRAGGEVQQLALLYTGQNLPTVLAIAEPPISMMCDLVRALLRILPRRFYAHLTEGVASVLANDYDIQSHGAHHKMTVTDWSRIAGFDGSAAMNLSTADTEDLLEFYAVSYPRNWFDPRMLETGFYYGIRRDGVLVSVAGIHVYSPRYRVAALGNIATRPDARGQGLAKTVTARLCQELRSAGIECIGLNVKADNANAIACYEELGFERIADYGEYSLQAK